MATCSLSPNPEPPVGGGGQASALGRTLWHAPSNPNLWGQQGRFQAEEGDGIGEPGPCALGLSGQCQPAVAWGPSGQSR